MSVIYKFLFPSKPDGTAMSLLILALRILFGILLMSHGVQKWANYDVHVRQFSRSFRNRQPTFTGTGYFW